MLLKFNVLSPNSSWHADGEEFVAGEHEVEDASAELVKLAGSAHAAGVLEVTEGLDVSHVESQEDSEAKLVEAMGTWIEPVLQEDGTTKPGYWDGEWAEGHLAQAAADAEARAVGSSAAEFAIDIDAAHEES